MNVLAYPVGFTCYLGKGGRIVIPKEMRESVGVNEGDIVQITVTGIVFGKKYWVVPRNQLTTCAKVQRRYVVRIPDAVRKGMGLRSGRRIIVWIEKIVRGSGGQSGGQSKSKSKPVYIRKEYIEKYGIHTGDIIQITIVEDGKELPESRQLTVTTRMQKTTAYIPGFVADLYGSGIRVRVDKVVK